MPEDVFSVLRPVFLSTKVIGFAPFSLNFRRLSTPDLAWSLLVLAFLVGISSFSLSARTDDSAVISRVTDYLQTRLCVTSLCAGLVFACLCRKSIVGVVQDLHGFDREFQVYLAQDIRKKYKVRRWCMLGASVAIWVYIVGLFAVDIVGFTKPTLTSIGQIFAYAGPLLTVFIEMQFCALILLLKERFAWLNDNMVDIGRSHGIDIYQTNPFSKVTPVYIISRDSKRLTASLQQVSIHHHRLCCIGQNLNKAYAFQILLILLQAFMTIIAVSFNIARLTFTNAFAKLPFSQRLYFQNMLLLHLLVVFVLVVVCSSTTKEAQKTGILLHKFVTWDNFQKAGKFDLGVICFSLQLIHHNVKFTACKLFVIDETLLYSIAGAVTTYLVIVLQFEFGSGGPEEEAIQSLNKITH